MKSKNSESICNPEVFRKVFDKLAESVRNFMYYKTGNLQRSEDICQEAFLRLWKNCASVPVEKAKSYLFTISNNLFLDEVKHAKVVLKFKETKPVSNSTKEDPQFILETKQFKEKLEKAISALPEKQRVVFLMNRIEKFTYREIAERLEISQKAVEKRMHNALKELKILINSH